MALGKTVTMSSVFLLSSGINTGASLAVDNVVPGIRATEECECCSLTRKSLDNWLTVDLGALYSISSVFVQGRTDYLSYGEYLCTIIHLKKKHLFN